MFLASCGLLPEDLLGVSPALCEHRRSVDGKADGRPEYLVCRPRISSHLRETSREVSQRALRTRWMDLREATPSQFRHYAKGGGWFNGAAVSGSRRTAGGSFGVGLDALRAPILYGVRG